VNRNRKFREAFRYVPDKIEEMLDEGRNPESEILSTVTHRLNLPLSWRRITSHIVADAKFKLQLEATVQRAKESQLKEIRQSHESELDQLRRELAEKSADLKDFLELTTAEIETKNHEINSLRDERVAFGERIEELGDSIRELEATNEAKKFALQERKSVSEFEGDSAVRDAVAASLKKGIGTVEDVLRLVAELYPERIVILNTAYRSAKESQMFKNPERVLALLLDLAGEYWQKLNDGKGDGEARQVFGNSYAANEAEVISKQALKRRTFQYGNSPVVISKHLKIGTKDTTVETLRIHFEWFADQKKIVLGHCGKHLKL
jgi:hypothetical protein